MTVIDLLNKIANGEELPELIKHGDCIFHKCEGSNGTPEYMNNECGWFLEYLNDNAINLNDEIEIVEKSKVEKNKIEKLTYKGELIKHGSTEEFTDDIDDYCPAINTILDSIGIKINEIIDYINKEEN